MKLIFFAGLLTFFSGVSIAQAISQWRGPNRDGIFQESNLLKQVQHDAGYLKRNTTQGSIDINGKDLEFAVSLQKNCLKS